MPAVGGLQGDGKLRFGFVVGGGEDGTVQDPGLLLHASLTSVSVQQRVHLPEHSQLSLLTHALQGKKSRAVRYSAAAGLDEDVFLHPNSTLHSTAPEFVVYAELIRTAKRPYMAGGSEACFRVQWDACGGMPVVGRRAS